MEDIYDKFCFW